MLQRLKTLNILFYEVSAVIIIITVLVHAHSFKRTGKKRIRDLNFENLGSEFKITGLSLKYIVPTFVSQEKIVTSKQ